MSFLMMIPVNMCNSIANLLYALCCKASTVLRGKRK